MDYQTTPDIKPDADLTVQDLVLFQRFRQEADLKTLWDRLDSEVVKHVRLCELSILYHASCRYYWAPLPMHPIEDVTTWAFRHLEEKGFKVENRTDNDAKATGGATAGPPADKVTKRWFASWLHRDIPDGDRVSAEWRRREALEDDDRAKHPPAPMSELTNGEISPGNAVWAVVVDGKYLAEVQRLNQRNFLCVFNLADKVCLHCEHTSVAFGALFGPDVGDVEEWQKRVLEIVDALQNSRDGGPAAH